MDSRTVSLRSESGNIKKIQRRARYGGVSIARGERLSEQ